MVAVRVAPEVCAALPAVDALIAPRHLEASDRIELGGSGRSFIPHVRSTMQLLVRKCFRDIAFLGSDTSTVVAKECRSASSTHAVGAHLLPDLVHPTQARGWAARLSTACCCSGTNDSTTGFIGAVALEMLRITTRAEAVGTLIA